MTHDFTATAKRFDAAYTGGKAGRIPVISPVAWSFKDDPEAKRFGDWRDNPDFQEVVKLAYEHCDPMPTFCEESYPGVWEPIGYGRFLEAPAEFVEKLPPERISAIRTRHTTLLHTPKGDLKWMYEEDDGVFTQWDMIKPIQEPKDVEKMLSVPYKFNPPKKEEYKAFRKNRKAQGAFQLGGAGVNSMVAMLVGMMEYELALEWIMTEPGLIKLLADEWKRRTSEKVAYLQSMGVGPYWHFNGVERAAPPMMSPVHWEEWVVPYDGEIMRQIKAADRQARIHVHCHGKVKTLLDSFVAMGVDSTDPVEPLPQGNVDFAEAKKKYKGKLTFFGNIEFLDIETKTPAQMDEIVRHAVLDNGRDNLVLTPSATPHEKPSAKCLANCRAYIEAGVKYGSW